MEKLIVSRHPGAIAFVRAELPGWAYETVPGAYPDDPSWEATCVERAEVVPDATADQVRGADVVGNLPMHLACLCARYRAIELPAVAFSDRGRDLTPAEMRAAGARIVEYKVVRV